MVSVVASIGALAWSIPAIASSARTARTASSTKPAKIGLYKTNIGKILICDSGCPTGQTGYTVYSFTKDAKKQDACQHIPYCLQSWPPVLSKGKPIAGTGVKQSLLGTIKLKNGKNQVTYAGRAIYTYIGDASKHETSFVNYFQFQGYWPGLNAAGQELNKQGKPTTK
jgi:predicted lipoprotein with Yx(FWY)xxD motif